MVIFFFNVNISSDQVSIVFVVLSKTFYSSFNFLSFFMPEIPLTLPLYQQDL